VQVNCSKCSRPIAVTDVVECGSGGHLMHLDCIRPHALTAEERSILSVYCSNHAVAQCLACGISFTLSELAADRLGGRTNLCPRCRRDLTVNVRIHLYGCVRLPAEIRLRAQEVRDAAQLLIKRSQELSDKADVLIRGAETHLLKSQMALRAAMARRASDPPPPPSGPSIVP
jgi:hypothetical protein